MRQLKSVFMNMVIEFFCSHGWLSLSLRTDDRKEIFFLWQIIKSVLLQADEFGIDSCFFCPGCKINCQLFGISGFGPVGNGDSCRQGYGRRSIWYWFLGNQARDIAV